MSNLLMILAIGVTIVPLYVGGRIGKAYVQWDFRVFHYPVLAIILCLSLAPVLVYSQVLSTQASVIIGWCGLAFGLLWMFRVFAVVDRMFKEESVAASLWDRVDSWMARCGIGISQVVMLPLSLLVHYYGI